MSAQRDLFPTLMNLAGLPIAPELRGHDLTGAIATGVERPGCHVLMESHRVGYGANQDHQCAVATRTHEYIEDVGTREQLLFDLERDPGELRDRSHDDPDRLVELRRASNYFRSFGRD